ncbi:MAG: hypothetical protein NTZ40_14795 [Cyanobacteria bacterium]|nr:hypothetical protein [Cyanobacteriota bacterium]
MTFGNPFGLALYDKGQRQVSSAGGQGDGPQRPGGQQSSRSRPEADSPSAAADSPAQDRSQATAPTPPPSAPADSGQVALDAETIQHLHSTLRALPRPLLESLARAFRKRFQVPEAAATIADRINQKCHHDWIETFLVSHREVRQADQHQASTQRAPGAKAHPLLVQMYACRGCHGAGPALPSAAFPHRRDRGLALSR